MGVPMDMETVKSLRRAAKDIVTQNNAPQEEQERRLAICGGCEHKKGAKCNLCGCFLNYKTRLASSECPMGEWSAFLPETSVDSPSE